MSRPVRSGGWTVEGIGHDPEATRSTRGRRGHEHERGRDRDPAAARERRRVHPSVVRPVHGVEPDRDPPDRRGQQERDGRRRREANRRNGTTPPALGMNVTSGRRGPGPGSGRRSRRRGRRAPAWAAASSWRSIASAMIAAISPHLSAPIPRDVTAGVPTRIPDDVFGGCRSNGIWFLLTVIPISSRRRSASLPVTPATSRRRA